MNKVIKVVKLVLLSLSLISVLVFFFPKETFKQFGAISWFFLILVMVIRPLSNLFPRCRLLSFLMKFRREYGILMGVFALAHGIGAFMMYKELVPKKTYFDILIEEYVWDYTRYIFWGMIAILLTIPLLVTSNGLSVSLMGKHWKTLHRLSYIIFPGAAIHIAIINKKHIDVWPIVIVLLWIVLNALAYFKIKSNKKFLSSSSWPKRLCIPCGYIYDESIGDPDSGIPPGTRFEDIPDSWRCPVCGVSKSDFILTENEIQINESEIDESEIVSIDYLTPNVIELKVDLKRDLEFTPGQFLTFALEDKDGSFNRPYSITNKTGTIYTFLIKLKPNGRAGAFFKSKKAGDKIMYTQVSGKFNLKNTKNPKIFIATGTGLSPIYNMILNTPLDIPKRLYFGVSKRIDLFYVDKLKEIKNLELNIYLSKEKVNGYYFGRIDLSNETFPENSEFYICGSAGVVKTFKEVLQKRGFSNIYFEEF